jgi:hypothetical protein
MGWNYAEDILKIHTIKPSVISREDYTVSQRKERMRVFIEETHTRMGSIAHYDSDWLVCVSFDRFIQVKRKEVWSGWDGMDLEKKLEKKKIRWHGWPYLSGLILYVSCMYRKDTQRKIDIFSYMYVCMNGWMDEWMNGWMDEWMNGWMNECVEGRKGGREEGRKGGREEGRKGGRGKLDLGKVEEDEKGRWAGRRDVLWWRTGRHKNTKRMEN